MINTQEIIRQTTSDTKILILCHMIWKKENTVSDLSEYIKTSRANISKQIAEMKKAGLLIVREEGRNNFYSLTKDLHPQQLTMIKAMVNSFHYIDQGDKDMPFIKL